MDIRDVLSSQSGERGSEGNRKAAWLCLETPALLEQIVGMLGSKDKNIAADCCEVLTEAAKIEPEQIVPYADSLPAMFHHKSGRAQWEAMHCYALISSYVPDKVKVLLPELMTIYQTNKGVIVRDYAMQVIAGYAAHSTETAMAVYPFLIRALSLWEGKQTIHILPGLARCYQHLPQHRTEIAALLHLYCSDAKPSVQKEARRLLKTL